MRSVSAVASVDLPMPELPAISTLPRCGSRKISRAVAIDADAACRGVRRDDARVLAADQLDQLDHAGAVVAGEPDVGVRP